MFKIDIDDNGFNKRIEGLFKRIEDSVSNPNNFQDIARKARKGLRENREMTIENELNYAQMKYSLKQEGLIPQSTPLSVTGQLIKDLYYDTMNRSPNEILGVMTFRDEERLRPTYSSMWQVYREEIESLDYQASKSSDVVRKLQVHKGWPIIETLYKGYKQDFVRTVQEAVAEAFRRSRR